MKPIRGWIIALVALCRRLRFSLLRLTLGILLIAALLGLWMRSAPWAIAQTLDSPLKYTSARFSHDGLALLTFSFGESDDGTGEKCYMSVWDLQSATQRFLVPSPTHNQDLYFEQVEFSTDDRWIVFDGGGYNHGDELKWVINAQTGEDLPLSGGLSWPQNRVAFSRDCREWRFLKGSIEKGLL